MALPKKNISNGLEKASVKLAESGISEDEALHMQMEVVKASDLSNLFHPIAALKIPYLDVNGKDSGFYRVRYLESLPGFGTQLAKPQRYAQPKDTVNWAYLPAVSGLDWSKVALDSSMQVVITEGELKAACACLRGHLTIALGGVSVWQSSKKKIPLLPPLDKFNWKSRRVTVIFDSDAATNPQVAAAQLRLADELFRLGALPDIATLPPSISNTKQGLDDFLVAGGSMRTVLAEARSTQLGQAIVNINERYAYVCDQDVVIELETARRLKRDGFVNGLMANNRVIEYQLNAQNQSRRIECVVPSEWLKWASRRSVGALTYKPGKPRITECGNFNMWKAWGCEPKAGDIKPWLELLDFLFDGNEADKAWFEKWCAYPLQNPGAKLYAAVVLWGPETGTGKSLIGYTLGRIYGTNFAEIGNTELHASFNEWAVGKQFVLGDEITGNDRRHEADKLKQLITQQTLRVNMKHLPTYEIKDCLNYYFTSNHPDAFFLEDQDRRFFIHRVPHNAKPQAFYVNYMDWLDKGEGASALFQRLLSLDLAGFNPAAPAPITASKAEMVDHARSDLSAFVSNMLRNLDMELKRLQTLYALPCQPDLVLNKHLRHLYDPDNTVRVTANGLGRELSRHGLKTLEPILTKSLGRQRFYIMRNTDKWLHAKIEDIRDYIDMVYQSTEATKEKY